LLAARYSSRLFANPFVIRPFAEALKAAADGRFLKDPKEVENVARLLKNLFDQDKELFTDIENDFNEIQSRAANNRMFDLGSTFFNNKVNMNNAKFVGEVVNKTKNQVSNIAPNTVVSASSQEAQSPEVQVKVPEQTQVARPIVPDINEIIDRPLSAQRAEVLFPQDELLQASLKRRA